MSAKETAGESSASTMTGGIGTTSAALLWQKAGGNVHVDARIMAFMAADDVLLDREFLPWDIGASRAHVEGLARIGVLSDQECGAIQGELAALAEDLSDGRFVLDDRFEDGHSAIEARLVERLGAVGKKVHTGRSRNDQVLVASRLWLKDQLCRLERHCIQIAKVCMERAEAEPSLPMPGYTHLQRAVVSSTAMWFAGWAEAFTEDAIRARQTRDWIDRCPLGTAAGYGINVPLDRDFTAAQLGFARLQCSPIAAQLSRGKFEMAALEAFCSASLDVRRLAWDLSLFSSAEFHFVTLPPQYTTGSSIMPNKRNPDVVELLRGSYARVSAARAEIEQALSLPSGYQRDLQLIKSPLVRGCRAGLDQLAIVPDLLGRLGWNAARMRGAIEPAMYATDVAVEYALGGMPFREAYRAAAQLVEDGGGGANALHQGRSPEASLAARISPGAAANPLIERVKAELDGLRRAEEEKEEGKR